MNTTDSIDLNPTAFYQWDSTPYPIADFAPDPGVATDSAYSLLMVRGEAVQADSLVRPSMFVDHGLDLQHSALTTRPDGFPSAWVFVVLLLLTALLTLYYRRHKLRIADLLHSLVDSRAMDRMLRGNNLTHTLQLVPVGLLVVACLMLPVQQLAMAKTGLGGYLLLCVIVAVAYQLRNVLIGLLGVIFDNHAVESYITSNYLYHMALTTLTLPLLFLFVYLPFGHSIVTYLLFSVVCVGFVTRLIRGMKLFLTHSSGSHFYLFYYLCTVELVPILVLLKWLIE